MKPWRHKKSFGKETFFLLIQRIFEQKFKILRIFFKIILGIMINSCVEAPFIKYYFLFQCIY